MNILPLTLKKKWFDMILSGEKKEEYREIKPYWNKRIMNFILKQTGKKMYIKFTNGYGKHRPSFVIRISYFKVGCGRPEWGAEKNKEYYIIRLGKIIEKKT